MKNVGLLFILLPLAFTAACGDPAANTPNANAAPAGMTLSEAAVPQRIRDMMAQRGEQDQATPAIKITAPEDGSMVESSTVNVEIEISGDLKGYMPGMDPKTKMGNHIHVILDNQPYEAYYDIKAGLFELRNVPDGEHTLRVFASRPWHESYKNEGAFDMIRFTVKRGGADPNQPAATNTGQQMSNANTAPTPEGKDMAPSQGGNVDAKRPLLTYSRPKGEYRGDEADPIMIDFWLANARLTGDGGEYRVRYSVDGGAPKFIETWAPLWLQGWTAGKHTVKLDLVDASGNVVDNGGYNSTSREITVVK
jgi:hypothetical protein